MSFTYDLATPSGIVRLLVGDTDSAAPIWSDAEVAAALQVESSQGLYVSGQAAPTAQPFANPYIPQVYSPYRAAALLLDSLAANYSRIQSVIELLDVKLSAARQSQDLRAQAANYREVEANAGHFAIAEMVQDQFSARERIWKVAQRLNVA